MQIEQWLWPALTIIATGLWLHEWLKKRRSRNASHAPASLNANGRVDIEDTLRVAHLLGQRANHHDVDELCRASRLSRSECVARLEAMCRLGLARLDADDTVHLTPAGAARARELLRTHRLWERYLVQYEGRPVAEVHSEAHRREHVTTPEQAESLDKAMGYPPWDPHGHIIPEIGHDAPVPSTHPLQEMAAPGVRLQVISVDDEPEDLLAQLMAMGLKPGAIVTVLDTAGLRLQVGDEQMTLAPEAAAHVHVIKAPGLVLPLGELPVGSRAQVIDVSGAGRHQRRMLDMGFVPGAEVEVVREAPLGDPAEFRVKGTAVALRREDADTILVEEG